MNKSLDLSELFKKVYDVVLEATKGSLAPIAYISVRLGNGFPFSDNEIHSHFKELKWNSLISAADLTIVHDSGLTSDVVKIEEISEFMDDEGNCKVYRDFSNSSIKF